MRSMRGSTGRLYVKRTETARDENTDVKLEMNNPPRACHETSLPPLLISTYTRSPPSLHDGLEPAGMQDDEAIRGAKAWYRESKYSHPDNVHLVAYGELLKNVSRFHKSTHTPKTCGNYMPNSCTGNQDS
ncbi:hypothetical protein BU17DRAFT_64183 [Hysterangium stoloniferum]|nr:hypothetical protein BU17DRAFT_64183 [Hysterangium stoloniferum]